MKRKAITVMMLTLLLISMLTLTFKVQPVKSSDPEEYTIVLQPGSEGKDADIREFDLGLQQGVPPYPGDRDGFLLGSFMGINNLRGIIEWNLKDIPSDAKILNADMTLAEISPFGPLHEYRAHVYRITESWEEMYVTWSKRDNVHYWATSGVTHDGYEWAYTEFKCMGHEAPPYQFIHWDITSLVQAWVSGMYPNYGLLLYPETLHIEPLGSHTDNYAGFCLSDHSNPTCRPKLTVTFVAEKYDELKSLTEKYNELKSSYDSLKNEYDNLSARYYKLEAVHKSLEGDCAALKSDFNSLKSDYAKLRSDYETTIRQLEIKIGELSRTTNLMYVLTITTIVFIATTVYFAKRKPKTT